MKKDLLSRIDQAFARAEGVLREPVGMDGIEEILRGLSAEIGL
jgi:hypothetical protein